jgi:hypothetical protein
LKRNIPSFTVEVRRQPRRASNPSANGRLFETALARTAFDRDAQRAADAVFEAKAPEPPLPDPAPSAPKGRILPSLVVDDAAARSFREDPPEFDESSRGPAKRRSARLQKTAKPSKPRRISVSPTAETAPPADSGVVSGPPFAAHPAEAIVVPPSEAAGSAGAPGSHKAPKRRVKKRKVPEYDRIAAWLAEPEPTIIANSPRAAPSAADEVSPTARKRTILGRYVFGDELKPGERWKRLLRKTR